MPRGWPASVSTPGTPHWEASAAAWLLEMFPDYRAYRGMCEHPAVLAFTARHILTGAVEGARQGYRLTRGELGPVVPPPAIGTALNELRAEGQRLSAVLRSVELVEQALRGH